jgi:DNA-binding NtrC family response regulator
LIASHVRPRGRIDAARASFGTLQSAFAWNARRRRPPPARNVTTMATFAVDKRRIRNALAVHLEAHGYTATVSGSSGEGLVFASRSGPDVVVMELCLPGVIGVKLFECVREGRPAVVCVLMFGSRHSPALPDDRQASDDESLSTYFGTGDWLLAISRALASHGAYPASREGTDPANHYAFDNIVGIGPRMQQVFRFIARVASQNVTVLLLGESGTGKELVVRSIHDRSPRRAAPFVAVNCSAIPSTLFESEFFGFERGAFTDAKETHAGKFEQADKGTLFLDEVGDLPLDGQAKLLRVLEEREVTRIGARRPIRVDVRLLAATNKDLDLAVRRGEFREDLYWRLNVLSLHLPPLRDRPEDLPHLIHLFVERSCRDMGVAPVTISAEARRLLMTHTWPGNVRELENTIYRALLLREGTELLPRDLPPRLRTASGDDSLASGGTPGDTAPTTLGDAIVRATERIERTWIQSALSEHRGNRTAAAEALGINRKTLFNKMRAYGVGFDDALEAR